jgi:hypothetical protein
MQLATAPSKVNESFDNGEGRRGDPLSANVNLPESPDVMRCS